MNFENFKLIFRKARNEPEAITQELYRFYATVAVVLVGMALFMAHLAGDLPF